MALPLAYIAAKGVYPGPAYTSLMALPAAMGAPLMLYAMFTASYRRLVRCICLVVTIAALASPS